METIQVVLDSKLRAATDRAARRAKSNRSAFIREALREHIRNLQTRSLEDRDREGYLRQPAENDEFAWEAEAAWPPESDAK
jgi:metal-responsive CopG/Arc/MetJ family transcriptional regulator